MNLSRRLRLGLVGCLGLVGSLILMACGAAPAVSLTTVVTAPADLNSGSGDIVATPLDNPSPTPIATPTAPTPTPTRDLVPRPDIARAPTHIVAAGETLSTLAEQYGITLEALAAYNQLTNLDTLEVGQVLLLPPEVERPAEPESGETAAGADAAPLLYTVQAGDSLQAIAQQFGVSLEALAAANGLTNPNAILAGQQLLIPAAVAVQQRHLVQAGETLSTIAQQYNLAWEALATANALTPPYILYAGQELIIPAP